MARSDERSGARRHLRCGMLALLALPGAALVSGCSSTQDEAARLQLNAARIRAAETHTVVRSPGGRLRVTRLSVVSSSTGSAVVVALHNPGPRAVADLPISIAERAGHRAPVYLNAFSTQELSYFDSHVPSVAAGGDLDWVYTTHRAIGRGARTFARVGGAPAPAVTRAGTGTPPAIRARLVSETTTRGRSRIRVVVRNTTSVPQYQLQLYAIGRRGSRAVAAGALTVPHLGSHRSETVSLPVIGPLAHVRLELTAVPTIFQ